MGGSNRGSILYPKNSQLQNLSTAKNPYFLAYPKKSHTSTWLHLYYCWFEHGERLCFFECKKIFVSFIDPKNPFSSKFQTQVILLSMRGTADSDNWHLHLAEKPMVRSYHLLDYDWMQWWLPLDNLRRMRIEGSPLLCPNVPRGRKTSKALTSSNSKISRDKSFADDLNKEGGIVSCRVAFQTQKIPWTLPHPPCH